MQPNDKTTLCVSGLDVHAYGLKDVRDSQPTSVDVVFLLHGRTSKYQDLKQWVWAILSTDKAARAMDRGLIVVSFDQRNHGHRQVSALSNLSWADGNEVHA